MTKRLQNRILGVRDSAPTRAPGGATISAARSDNSLVFSSSSWSAVSIPSMSALPNSQGTRLPPPPPTPTEAPNSPPHSSLIPFPLGSHTLSELAVQTSNAPILQDSAQTGQPPSHQRRNPRALADASKPSSKRNSLYISNSSAGGDLPNPARQFTVACIPDHGTYMASPLRKSRKPSPTPQSISSSSSKSSVSYVSLKSGKKSVHSDHVVTPFTVPALQFGEGRLQPRAFLYEPLDEQEGEPEYDTAANLLLPEERERVQLWTTQVMNSAVPEEDVILADGETVARLPSRLGADIPSIATTPTEESTSDKIPRVQLEYGPMSFVLQSDPRWIVDTAKKKWIWCGLEIMPPLPRDAVAAGFEAQPLDLGFRQPSAGTLRHPQRSPFVETPGSYPTPIQSTPIAHQHQSLGSSPKPVPVIVQELLPPHHEFVPLISPSPLSQLPPLRARVRSSGGRPILPPALSAPEPSISSYQGQPPYRSSSPRREPSPEVPGRLVAAAASTFPQQQSTVWSGGSKSTKSGRGRSPTRRSWKATSQRSKVSKGFTITPPMKKSTRRPGHDGTGLSDISSSPSRPRTTTRSPSSDRPFLPTPGPVADLTDSPSISSSKLFFGFATGPTAPLPPHPADVSHSASVAPPPTIISIPTQPSPLVDRSAPWHILSNPRASALPSHFHRRSIPATVVSLDGSLATSVEPPTHQLTPMPVFRAEHPPGSPNILDPRPSKHEIRTGEGVSNRPSEASAPTPTPARPPVSSNSDAFLRLLSTVNDFTSELSSDKRGTPRWKTENVDLAERVRDSYYEFHQQIARTRVRFRPWMSSGKELAADEATLVDELDGDRAKALGPVMYLDDVMEELEGTAELKRRCSADEVQERITQSIVKQWKQLAMDCLNSVQRLLANYISSMIFSHFSQNAVEELENLVVAVVQTQLKSLLSDTAARLQDLITLEYSNMFSLSINRYRSSRTLLSRYKSLRHRTHRSYIMRSHPNIVRSTSPPGRPSVGALSHAHPGSGPQSAYSYSRSVIGVQSISPRNPNSTAIARLKRFSLLGSGSDSTEYHQDMKLALAGLSNLGFKDMDADRLCELLSEDDPSDEALEVMAEVDSYFEVASARFSDYAAIQIEHHLVNQLGPRVNDALLRALNLTGDDIKERAAQWMPAPETTD